MIENLAFAKLFSTGASAASAMVQERGFVNRREEDYGQVSALPDSYQINKKPEAKGQKKQKTLFSH